MTIRKGTDMTEGDRKRDRQAREERIDRGFEELRKIFRENEVIFARWRAEGFLPPEEPRRRF